MYKRQPYDGLFMFSFQLLSEDYGIEIALVKLRVLVIVVRHDFQPRIVDGPEWEYAVVKIDQVGMILVYHVHCAVEEVVVVALWGDRGSFGPVPCSPSMSAQGMILYV